MNEEFFLEKREDRLFSESVLDYPISLFPFLTYHLEKNIQRHMTYLKTQHRKAKKIYVHLHCEYGHQVHLLEVFIPFHKNTVDNIMENVERRLLEIDLINPIKEIEIETIPYKKISLGHFENRNSFTTRLTSGCLAPEEVLWSSENDDPLTLPRLAAIS